jgi:hypothetical protein
VVQELEVLVGKTHKEKYSQLRRSPEREVSVMLHFLLQCNLFHSLKWGDVSVTNLLRKKKVKKKPQKKYS